MSMSAGGNAEQEFFHERGFGIPLGFGKKPALIVVDLTKGFTEPDRPLGSDLSSQIAACNQLLDAAHARDVMVIFSLVRYEYPDLRDAGLWAIKQKGSASLVADGDGHVFDERLHKLPGDSELPKKYASCFFGTDLLPRLVSAGVDTLIIAGTSTSGCVRATAVDTVQHGIRPMVVREAVGDRSRAAHEQSLFDLETRYADLVSLSETLAYLKSV